MGRRIDRYIVGYLDALDAGMPAPSGGDCWYCYLFEQANMGGADHLLSHMDESYYVPSLLWNAVKERGYGSPEAVMSMRLDYDALQAGTMRTRVNTYGEKDYIRIELRRDMRRYLRRRLLPKLAGPGPTRAPTV
jgi:hypothetical protein